MSSSYYADDPDAHVVYPVTDTLGGLLSWPDPTVTTGEIEIDAEWLGDPAATRDLKVPLADLPIGSYLLLLLVPGENDIELGTVSIVSHAGTLTPLYGGCSWPVDVACFDEDWDALSPAVRERALALASSTLERLTGNRVQMCPITVRPVPAKRGCWFPPLDWTYGPVAYNWAGQWYNCLPCDTTEVCQVELPMPVGRVDEVKIDGEVVEATEYRVDNARYLVWTGTGECPWPDTQNIGLPDTEPGTFSITYLNAFPPDSNAAYAAGVLAMEYARACATGQCRLPDGVTNITRQGVTMEIPSGAFPGGLTGIREVDTFISLWNPLNLVQNSQVWSPDMAQTRVTS